MTASVSKSWLPSRDTTLGQALHGVLDSRPATIAAVVFLLLVLAALLAPWIAPQNPYDLAAITILDGRMPPGSHGIYGDVYWAGTDAQGRDMLSAMMYGLRTSLSVGVLSGLFAMAVGTVLGLVAAYFGGRIDALIMRLVDLMLGFPTILVALMMLAILGQGVDKVILALVVVQWAYFARAVRATAVVERRKEYMEAALCLGLSHRRALFSQLLPNCIPPVIVIAMIQTANAIAAEATLSFLGIGLPVTEPSLGLLIANGYQQMLAGLYWISVFPGVLLLTVVFTMNIVGDRVREALNPRLQK